MFRRDFQKHPRVSIVSRPRNQLICAGSVAPRALGMTTRRHHGDRRARGKQFTAIAWCGSGRSRGSHQGEARRMSRSFIILRSVRDATWPFSAPTTSDKSRHRRRARISDRSVAKGEERKSKVTFSMIRTFVRELTRRGACSLSPFDHRCANQPWMRAKSRLKINTRVQLPLFSHHACRFTWLTIEIRNQSSLHSLYAAILRWQVASYRC